MGIFSSIAKIALTPSAFVAKQIVSVIKPSAPMATRPVSTIASQAAGTTFGKILGTAIAATAVAIPVAAFPATAVTAAKAVGKVAAKHPIATGVGALVVAPAIISSPKLQKGLGTAAKEIPTFGTGIGEVVEGEKSIVEFVKEHPITSAAVAAVGAIAVGKAVAPVVGGALVREGIVEQAEAIKGLGISEGGLPIMPTNPMTPQTVYMEEAPSVKPPTEARREKISQRVDVIVRQNNRNYSVSRKSQTYLNPIRLLN